MSLFLVSKYNTMVCSCEKSQIECLEFCKCEGDFGKNVSSTKVRTLVENDDEYSDEEEYGSEDEDDTENL